MPFPPVLENVCRAFSPGPTDRPWVSEDTYYVAWENSRHLATLPLVSPPNDIWETSAEIPYWRHVTTQIWVVLLIGCAAWEIWFNQSEELPRSGWWRVISMEFLRSFLKRHLAGKPVVASPNVSCCLRLLIMLFWSLIKKVKENVFWSANLLYSEHN